MERMEIPEEPFAEFTHKDGGIEGERRKRRVRKGEKCMTAQEKEKKRGENKSRRQKPRLTES